MNEILVREIALSLSNFAEAYRMTEQLRINFAIKKAKGIYNPQIAREFFARKWSPILFKLYCKETGMVADPLKMDDKTYLAELMLENYEEEINQIAEEIDSGIRDRRGAKKQPKESAPC